jgi:flagellar biosynthetic protein FliR
MPTLMVAFVGAPAITLGGLALLAVSAPIMLAVWGEAALALLAAPGLP